MAVTLLGALLPLVPAPPAAAHGAVEDIDQRTSEDCSEAEYPGEQLIKTTEARQSFVPSRGGLAAVEVCISNLVAIPGAEIELKLYEGGDLESPGEPVRVVEHDAPNSLLEPAWVHIQFPETVPTTPGTPYMIGLAGTRTPVTFHWRSTCKDTQAERCEGGRPDVYEAGETNDLPGNADYGFQTRPAFRADLVGAVTVDPAVCPGLDLTGRATGTVTNTGETAVAPTKAQWVWSSDPHLSPDDQRIDPSESVPRLDAGQSSSVPPPTLPVGLPRGRGHLVLEVDAGDVVVEPGGNNIAAAPTTVTACGQPKLTDLSLTVVEDEVRTGFGQVQFDDLDARALATLPQSPTEAAASPAFAPNGFSPNGFSPNGFSPNGFSANGFSPNGFSPNGFSPNGFSPNGFSPNGFSPNGFSPNGFSGAGGVLLQTVLADLPTTLLDQINIVNIPVVGDDWEVRLAGKTSQPIQDVTLREASALLPGLTLEEVDLTRVFSMSWMALALAGGRLDDTPVPGGWCAFIASKGSSCAELGVDPAASSLLALEAAGFPAHQAPIADLPLGSATLNPAFLVSGLPLTGSRSFHLQLTRLGQVAVRDALTTPSTVIDCERFGCDGPGTLAEAVAAGAIRNVTVATLLQGLSATGRAKGTVGDLAVGTASLGSLALSTANWDLANTYLTDPACPRARFRFAGENTGSGAAVDPTATVSLPPGFSYVPNSATLRTDGSAATAETEPATTVDGSGVRTLTFTLTGEIGSSFELAFGACAGLYLGAFPAGRAGITGLGIDGPYSSSTTATDVVRVVERTPGVTTTALAHPDNIVVADHISSAGAHDSWTMPVKEPGTMYVVKLFTPIGVDLDLIAYGPEYSANAFSPNGFSPNGFSPNGFSPNGFSPNGFSPNGFSPNGFSPNGFSPNGFSTTLSPDLNDDLPIEELRPPRSTGYAVSANRGDTPETLHLMGSSGDAGLWTFAVADYNGVHSDAPYFMTIQTVRRTVDPALQTCEAPPWDLAEAEGGTPSVPAGAKTIFVTNREVTASAYGAAAANAGIAALRELAARPEINGVVLEVDHDAAVRAAYAEWRSKWCDPTAANVVATQIRRRILELRELRPTIDTVVLAGGDAVIPDFRLDDRSTLANEDQYTAALLKATGTNNPVVSAFARGMIPSADPYGNEAPLPFGMSYAFPPSAGVSRLVETPADWVLQRDQYLASQGALDPASAFISAYDGMVDGADAAAEALRGAQLTATKLTDVTAAWTGDQFRAAALDNRPEDPGADTAGPDLAGWNGHANHFGLLSDLGSETNSQGEGEREVITTAESARFPLGGFVFSNACHFGTAITDILNRNPTTEEGKRLKDWAQAITSRRGIAVANSGFGIFDTVEVGQGERLQALFLEELPRSRNVSLALAKAKNRFFASPGVYDAYTYKTMQQLTMFGLGSFKLRGSTTEPSPAPRPDTPDATKIDLVAGPYAVPEQGSPCPSGRDCYLRSQIAQGEKIDLRDSQATTGATSTNGYARIPLSTREIRLPLGKSPAGLWINDIDSATLHNRDLVITRLGVDDPAREVEPQTAAPFPTSFGTVNEVGGTAFVTLLHGIAVPARMQQGKVRGDVHLYTRIDAALMLRDAGTTGCTPHIDEVTVGRTRDETRAIVSIRPSTRCGPNTRAAALGRDSGGEWIYGEARLGTDGHWSVGLPIAPDRTLEDLHVQVSNGRGVGHWRHKGDRPVINEDVVDGVQLALSGTQHPSGIFRSAVTATIQGTAGVLYRVYRNGVLTGTFTSGQSFGVSGDGAHEIEVHGSDGSVAARVVVIDASAPSIAWVSPPDGGTYLVGEVVTAEARCPDGISEATCTITIDGRMVPNGSRIPTDKIGTRTITVTATDGVGNTATSTRTITVRSRYVISQFFSPIKPKPQLNVVSPSSNVTMKFTVTDEAGNHFTNPAIIVKRAWQPINCSSKAEAGAAFGATGSTPEYSGFFHFNLSTPGVAGCYELIVELDDGSRAPGAYFQVKK